MLTFLELRPTWRGVAIHVGQGIKKMNHLARSFAVWATALLLTTSTLSAAVDGWLNWRGPDQNGTSKETNLPDRWVLGGENDLWSMAWPGRSASSGR